MLDRLTTDTRAHGLQLHSTKTKIISKTTSKTQNKQHSGSSRDEHRDLTAKRENQIPRLLHHPQKRIPSRVRPPHLMRVGNIHKTQTGVDVIKIHTEKQTQALRRHGDTITPLRFRYMDDDGRDEEETPDNTTTDDEDDHTDSEKIGKMSRSRTPRTSTKSPPADPTTPDSEPDDDTTEANSQDLTEHEDGSHDADSNPPTTTCQTANKKTNWSHGSTTKCEQLTKQTTYSQQEGERRGSSGRGYVGNKQE